MKIIPLSYLVKYLTKTILQVCKITFFMQRSDWKYYFIKIVGKVILLRLLPNDNVDYWNSECKHCITTWDCKWVFLANSTSIDSKKPCSTIWKACSSAFFTSPSLLSGDNCPSSNSAGIRSAAKWAALLPSWPSNTPYR